MRAEQIERPVTNRLRWITLSKNRLIIGLTFLLLFASIKVSDIEELSSNEVHANQNIIQQITAWNDIPRSRCQIIYILGVEGSIHHGFTPILHSLASKQTDGSGYPIDVQLQPRALRAALFGRFREKRGLDDPTLVHETITKLCPPDGRKHIIIEDSSFPCGQEGDPRGYRYPRQHAWLNMTMHDIASSQLALEHPVNLFKFVQLYEKHAEIKFIVLHRTFLETIASHADWDESVERHSNLIRGFMLILRRFLDEHKLDSVSGEKFWTIVCVERFMSQFYKYRNQQGMEGIDHDSWNEARQRILSYLADFLGWSEECSDCFDSWKEGSRDKVKSIKDEDVMPLLDHMKEMEGIWPPVLENGLPEQKCST